MENQPKVDLSKLSESELVALKKMREFFKDVEHPDKEDAPTSWFQFSDWTFLRYLRARRYDVKKAKDMLEKTIEFRAKWRPTKVKATDEDVKELLEMKFWRFIGYANDSSPVQITFASLFDATWFKTEESIVRIVLFQSESIMRAMQQTGWKSDHTIEIFEMQNYSLLKQANSKAMGILKTILRINDDHYPELLGKAIIFNAPLIFRGVWSIVKLWLDEGTISRVMFVNDSAVLHELIDESILLGQHGGIRNEDYPVLYDGWQQW